MADIKVSQLPVATNVGPTDTVMIVQSGVSKQATAEKVALADNGANVRHSLATAVNDFLVASAAGAFVKKTPAEVKTVLGLGDAAYKNTGTVAGTVSAGDHGHANNATIGGPYLLPASPAMTGTPTAPTAAAGTNSTQISTTAFVQAAIAALVASSPAALDTLNELAVALGNDPNFATTMTNALAGKAASGHGHANDANIGGPFVKTADIGSLSVSNAGTVGGLRIIRGSVLGNGTILYGTGFTVSKGATGYFTIYFNAAFSLQPSAAVTPVMDSGLIVIGQITAHPITTNFQVKTSVVNQAAYGTTASDQAFDFIVVGPA